MTTSGRTRTGIVSSGVGRGGYGGRGGGPNTEARGTRGTHGENRITGAHHGLVAPRFARSDGERSWKHKHVRIADSCLCFRDLSPSETPATAGDAPEPILCVPRVSVSPRWALPRALRRLRARPTPHSSSARTRSTPPERCTSRTVSCRGSRCPGCRSRWCKTRRPSCGVPT